VTEPTDQFQKFGKTLARKYQFKKIKKSDLNKKNLILNQKNLIIFIFLNHDFFQPCPGFLRMWLT